MKTTAHREQMEEDFKKIMSIATALKLRDQGDTQNMVADAIEEAALYLRESFGSEPLTDSELKILVSGYGAKSSNGR